MARKIVGSKYSFWITEGYGKNTRRVQYQGKAVDHSKKYLFIQVPGEKRARSVGKKFATWLGRK
jgi:hypothetical protein